MDRQSRIAVWIFFAVLAICALYLFGCSRTSCVNPLDISDKAQGFVGSGKGKVDKIVVTTKEPPTKELAISASGDLGEAQKAITESQRGIGQLVSENDKLAKENTELQTRWRTMIHRLAFGVAAIGALLFVGGVVLAALGWLPATKAAQLAAGGVAITTGALWFDKYFLWLVAGVWVAVVVGAGFLLYALVKLVRNIQGSKTNLAVLAKKKEPVFERIISPVLLKRVQGPATIVGRIVNWIKGKGA